MLAKLQTAMNDSSELKFVPIHAWLFSILVGGAFVGAPLVMLWYSSTVPSVQHKLLASFLVAISGGWFVLWTFFGYVLGANALSKPRRDRFRSHIVNWTWWFAFLSSWIVASCVLERLGD